MSSDDVMISVRGLGKSYTIAHDRKDRPSTLGEAVMQRLKRPLAKRAESETFWALKDVSFDVRRGDVVGVIGRNGAGKSTLFKVLSRITEPTTGRVDLYGRVGSLLEVGTGFSGELTGRENIFLNGTILGMRRAEIAKRFDEIVDFAGVEQFLDTPVKRYSSGMYVRLAFAVAAHLETEILIVDEVLAVGDAAFQAKCLAKIKQASTSGRTVMLVTHTQSIVRNNATAALLLEHGRARYFDGVGEALAAYSGDNGSEQRGPFNPRPSSTLVPSVTGVAVVGPYGGADVVTGQEVRIDVDVTVPVATRGLTLSIKLVSDVLSIPATFASYISEDRTLPAQHLGELVAGTHRFTCHIERFAGYRGKYAVRTELFDADRCRMVECHDSVAPFFVEVPPEFAPGLKWPDEMCVFLSPFRWERSIVNV